MKSLPALGHDTSDRLKAMSLAQEYGKTLYTGVFYRNAEPPPTYGSEVRAQLEELGRLALPRESIIDMFLPQEVEAVSDAASDLGGE